MPVNENECVAAGLDPKAVARLVRKLERAGKEAKSLGLTIFGGSGSGSLRPGGYDPRGPLVVGYMLSGSWDGGDGAEHQDSDGLMRGEGA